MTGLQTIFQAVRDISNNFTLNMNLKKTKYMTALKTSNINIPALSVGNSRIKKVRGHQYLEA